MNEKIEIKAEAIAEIVKKIALKKWHGPTTSPWGYQVRFAKLLTIHEWLDFDNPDTWPDHIIKTLHLGILIGGQPAGKMYLTTDKNVFSATRRVWRWQLSKQNVIRALLVRLMEKINDFTVKAEFQNYIDTLNQHFSPKSHVPVINTKFDSPLALWRVANKISCRKMGELLGITAASVSILESGKWRPITEKWITKINDLTGDPDTFTKMQDWYKGKKSVIEVKIPKIYQNIIDELGYKSVNKLVSVLSHTIKAERVKMFLGRQAYPNTYEKTLIASLLGEFSEEEVAAMNFES
jgi:hypothetical protein